MGKDFLEMPNEKGYFGEYGGQIIPPQLIEVMDQINDAYEKIKDSKEFKDELIDLQLNYIGRPSPIYHAKRISDKMGGAQII